MKEKKEHKTVRETAMYQNTGMRFQLLFYNAFPLIIVEIVYSVLSILIVGPLLRIYLKLLVSNSGLGTITSENYAQFLFKPLPTLCLILLIVCIGIYSLLDISAAIFTFDCSRQKKKVNIIEVAEFSIKNAVRIVKPKNLPMLIVVLVLLPLISLGVSSSFLTGIDIPSSAIDVVYSSIWAPLAFLAVIVILFVLSLRWAFAIHYFTIEQVDFITSVRKSAKLDRRHRILNIISMLVVQAVLALSTSALVLVGKGLATLISDSIGTSTILGSFLLAVVFVVFGLAIIILGTLVVPIGILKISSKYYLLKEISGEELVSIPYTPRPWLTKFRKVGKIVAGVLFIATIAIFSVTFYLASDIYGELFNNARGGTYVSAFRSGGTSAPDNTLLSIEKAANKSAREISVDAQVSSDGQVFLAKSPNLEMSSTLDKHASEATYEEISQAELSADIYASVLNKRDIGFPLLSTAIDTGRENNIGLIIDISTADYCADTVDLVADIVLESGYAEKCEISSRHYNDIERAQEIAPEIKTVFIAGIAFGSFEDLDCADALALESIAVSEDAILDLHAKGYSVYAWCTSSKEGCENAVVSKVDNIVATDIDTAKKAVETLGFSDFGSSIFSSFGTSK